MTLDDLKQDASELSVAELRELAGYCNDLADAIEQEGAE